ncbi:hypothetical protein PQX77_012671 [Marasmius sp. AFHP31]|nr:hypothetical protein PQX77_012671 [Marasmius sp. AFHP31]
MNEKQAIIQDEGASPAAARKALAEKYTEQVKRNQIHNELTVEMIVRKRSLEGTTQHISPLNPTYDLKQLSGLDSANCGTNNYLYDFEYRSDDNDDATAELIE